MRKIKDTYSRIVPFAIRGAIVRAVAFVIAAPFALAARLRFPLGTKAVYIGKGPLLGSTITVEGHRGRRYVVASDRFRYGAAVLARLDPNKECVAATRAQNDWWNGCAEIPVSDLA